MKNTIKYFITAVALLSGLTIFAQNLQEGTYDKKNGIAFRKSATLKPGTSDRYIIDLEAFVTGEVTVENKSVPADIVLVLDVSGSMEDPIHSERKTWRQSDISSGTYYYDAGDYGMCRVRYSNNRFQCYLEDYDYWYNISNGNTFTGTLYWGEKKIEALKTAVGAFIQKIQENDLYEKDEDGNLVRRKDESGADTSLGNQIAIVKFGSANYFPSGTTWNSTSAPIKQNGTGIHQNAPGNSNYNYTEVVRGFTKTDTQANVNDLTSAVNSFKAGGATASDFGMNLAYLLIKNLPGEGEEGDRSKSAKTVVFFTDGSPTHGSTFNSDVATHTISRAHDAKDEYEVKVFSVGVFDSPSDDINQFMNYTSSNYPDATSFSQGGTPIAEAKRVYFQDASDPNADLTKVFTTIAESSGGSGNTDVSGGSAVTVDVIASSFALPRNANEDDITILVAKCHGDTTINGMTYLAFDKPVNPSSKGFTITPTVNKEKNTVSTTGFDFSENWCGFDESKNEYRGYKQIIRFEITVKDNAVGGPNVLTNEEDSGIYLEGATTPLVKFNRPSVKIPVSIWIKKKGLVGEDTAVFNVEYSPYQPGVDPRTIEKKDWTNFTKIAVNSNSEIDPEDGLPFARLVGLDPDYFYRIREDKWAWSYTYQDDGIQYTFGEGGTNPFIFVNVPKEDIKEGEASVRNVFNERTTDIPTTPTEPTTK